MVNGTDRNPDSVEVAGVGHSGIPNNIFILMIIRKST